jgi:hypothetical protein
MNSKRPNSRRNLDAAIDRLPIAKENPLQIRIIMANTIIGQALPKGAVKGGSALKLRYGNVETRFTRDLDAARGIELDTFIQELGDALGVGWNDFTGKVVSRAPASPKGVPGEYIMKPFDIKLEYNGKPWITVPLEIGHDEIGDTAEPEYVISPDIVEVFIELGFPAPNPIPLMPIHHQIAQKLHALSVPGNERAHDLVDLQLIAKHEQLDYPLIKETCKRLFRSRNAQLWYPTIAKEHSWESLYSKQSSGLEVIKSLDDAIDWINDLIGRIDRAD